MKALVQYLNQFEFLTPVAKKHLQNCCSPKAILKNEKLLEVGEVCSKSWLVLDGSIRKVDQSGRTAWVYLEGHPFSETDGMFAGKASGFSFEAVEDSLVVSIDFKEYSSFQQYPDIQKLGEVLAQKQILFGETLNRILAQSNARIKYQQFIAQFPEYKDRLYQKDISSILGIAAETLSRIKN